MAPPDQVTEALATLRSRWGAAAPRTGAELGLETEGALARAPMPRFPEQDDIAPPDGFVALPATPARMRMPLPGADADGRVVSTGFAALDAVLGAGGLPRSATVALRGDHSSGKTTLALRIAAEAQAAGSIVAWMDLARAFDPVEAVARGVRPEWLVVLTPVDLAEALALAGALLAARTVDVLVMDLPEGDDPAVRGARIGDRLGRLAALARRAGTLLVLLEPVTLGRGLAVAVEQASGLRLELERGGWIRLGRDVVGQRSAVTIARNRYGPPGRRAELPILYAEGGDRDACLMRDPLLQGLQPAAPPGPSVAAEASSAPAAAPPLSIDLNGPPPSTDSHAPLAPALAASSAAPRPVAPGALRARGPLRLMAGRPDHPRGAALDGRDGRGRGPDRPGARRATRDPARDRAPARARGDLPRPRA